MLQTIVKDYTIVGEIESLPINKVPQGDSVSPKGMIFHILDNREDVTVLDIGFGTGTLGELVKNNPETSHWSVDGVDGWDINCRNKDLFLKGWYRNVWKGLAQELPSDLFSGYKIICLLDVIEHLSADTAKWLLRTLLSQMSNDAFLFISTPLWFYPQDTIQDGDLEEHLIGVPATSMMALMPKMYCISNGLVGGFVLTKKSLDNIEFFHPTYDKNFTLERGEELAKYCGMHLEKNVVFKM